MTDSTDLQELPVFVYHSQFSSAHKNQWSMNTKFSLVFVK